MASLTSGFKGAAIAALPLDGAGTVVDVGGADGTVLAMMGGQERTEAEWRELLYRCPCTPA